MMSVKQVLFMLIVNIFICELTICGKILSPDDFDALKSNITSKANRSHQVNTVNEVYLRLNSTVPINANSTVPINANSTVPIDANSTVPINTNSTVPINASSPQPNEISNFIVNKSQYTEAVEAIFGIGIRLQLILEQSEANTKNFLVSPLSTAIAVGQLMLGARGELRKQLADLLIIDGGELINQFMENKTNSTEEEIPLLYLHQQLGDLFKVIRKTGEDGDLYRIKTAGALFLQPGVRLKQLFEQSLDKIYETHIVPVNFSTDPSGTQKVINDWAVKSTEGNIKTILSKPAPVTSLAILANAIFFHGDWKSPFSSEFSKIAPFRMNLNDSVNATYMRDQIDVLYAENEHLGCKMIVLPYELQKASMYLILPNENNGTEYDIKNFTTKLKSKDVLEMIDSAALQSVTVIIPKMTLSNTLSILDPLKKYQLYKKRIQNVPRLSARYHIDNKLDFVDKQVEIFKEVQKEFNETKPFVTDINTENDGIVLSGASEDSEFKLTDIIQQMSLAINEKGTEAAVITAGIIDYIGAVKQFKADRPFLFFIRHEETGAILFWGTIVNPVS